MRRIIVLPNLCLGKSSQGSLAHGARVVGGMFGVDVLAHGARVTASGWLGIAACGTLVEDCEGASIPIVLRIRSAPRPWLWAVEGAFGLPDCSATCFVIATGLASGSWSQL